MLVVDGRMHVRMFLFCAVSTLDAKAVTTVDSVAVSYHFKPRAITVLCMVENR